MIELLLQAEDALGRGLVDAQVDGAGPASEPPLPRLPFSRYAAEEG